MIGGLGSAIFQQLESAVQSNNAENIYTAAMAALKEKERQTVAATTQAAEVLVASGATGGAPLADQINGEATLSSLQTKTAGIDQKHFTALVLLAMAGAQGETSVSILSNISDISATIPSTMAGKIENNLGLMVPMKNTGDYHDKMTEIFNIMQTGAAPSSALKTMMEGSSPSFALMKLLKARVLSLAPTSSDYLASNMYLLAGETPAADWVTAFTTGTDAEKFTAAVSLLPQIGVTNTPITALNTLLASTDAISSTAFKTVLATFLDSVWPGLSTELSIP